MLINSPLKILSPNNIHLHRDHIMLFMVFHHLHYVICLFAHVQGPWQKELKYLRCLINNWTFTYMTLLKINFTRSINVNLTPSEFCYRDHIIKEMLQFLIFVWTSKRHPNSLPLVINDTSTICAHNQLTNLSKLGFSDSMGNKIF